MSIGEIFYKGRIFHWLSAVRINTLIASISPVMIGTSFAIRNIGMGGVSLSTFVFTFIEAVSIQIGTNLCNDYFDGINGVDGKNRKGPPRMVATKKISPKSMKRGVCLFFSLAMLMSLLFFAVGSWFIITTTFVAVLLGFFYSGGPKPISYTAWSDFLAFLFFGPIATLGAYFLQAHELNWEIALWGIIPGAFATALLTINNIRDVDDDKSVNKNTTVVCLGKNFGCYQLTAMFVIAFVVTLTTFFLYKNNVFVITLFAFFPEFLSIAKEVFFCEKSEKLNDTLKKMCNLQKWFTLFYCIGIVFDKLK